MLLLHTLAIFHLANLQNGSKHHQKTLGGLEGPQVLVDSNQADV